MSKEELELAYLRKLHAISSIEIQMRDFVADLSDQTTDFKFGSSIHGLVRLCRERQQALESMLSENENPVEAEGSENMKRLIADGLHELRHSARGQSRDVVIADICISLHRFLLVNYGLAEDMALQLGWIDHETRLGELVDLIVERFPQRSESPARRTAFSRPALAQPEDTGHALPTHATYATGTGHWGRRPQTKVA